MEFPTEAKIPYICHSNKKDREAMKYKLLVLDIDGTLLNNRKEISPRTQAALLKAQQWEYILYWHQEDRLMESYLSLKNWN